MKEISKEQMIDLMSVMNRDGIENGYYSIDALVSEKVASDFYGGDEAVKLKPGAYCAIWFDEPDFSDFPNIRRWIEEKLEESNYLRLKNGDSWIVVICLELL